MRLDRRQKIALAASTTTLAACGVTAWWILKPRALGRLICPASRIVPSDALTIGSFVVLQLASNDGKVNEPTWAQILDYSFFGKLEVQIVGEIDETGSPIQLATPKHGFALDQELSIDPACVWDVYKPPIGSAVLLCGAMLLSIPEDAGVPRQPDPDASKLRRDDDAAIVIAAEGDPTEMIWLRVESSSPGSQSFTGRVLQPTLHPDVHGIRQGDKLQFLRDCVVDVRIGGGT